MKIRQALKIVDKINRMESFLLRQMNWPAEYAARCAASVAGYSRSQDDAAGKVLEWHATRGKK